MMACLDACGIQNQITDTGRPGKFANHAAELAENALTGIQRLVIFFQRMKKLYTYNYISRIIFLLVTPTLFRALNFAFIWHSIYWGG